MKKLLFSVLMITSLTTFAGLGGVKKAIIVKVNSNNLTDALNFAYSDCRKYEYNREENRDYKVSAQVLEVKEGKSISTVKMLCEIKTKY